MGLDYSYEIFIPQQHDPRALTGVAELAPQTVRVPPLTVTLPGGECIVMPFTYSFKREPVDFTAIGVLDLYTSLMFPIDGAVHAYFRGRDYEIDERDRA